MRFKSTYFATPTIKALRVFLIVQLFFCLARSVFDGLGAQWGLVVGGIATVVFSATSFVASGSANRFSLIIYCLWSVCWIGFNIVCILLYAGLIDETASLDFNRDKTSWWVQHNFLVDGKYVEVIWAGVQVLLSAITVVLAMHVTCHASNDPFSTFDEDDGFSSYAQKLHDHADTLSKV
eukprot:m.65622 g.65622  ORF g.65622 m.65622 type:complete len:179 (-) comp13678_c0_seq1:348-884(-)